MRVIVVSRRGAVPPRGKQRQGYILPDITLAGSFEGTRTLTPARPYLDSIGGANEGAACWRMVKIILVKLDEESE